MSKATEGHRVMNWPTLGALALIIGFRAAILGVTAYAVFWLDHSGWWFVLAVLLCGG